MPYLLTFLAAFASLIGIIPIFIKFKNETDIINIALSFAIGVMLTVTIFDLMPESFNILAKNFIGIIIFLLSINIGIVLSMLTSKLIPTEDNLYRVGVISFLAIIMHNIPEGIITYVAALKDIKLGIVMALAIALHNIPEGISIALPIYYSKKSKLKAFFYTLISGASEILGALIASLFAKYITTNLLGILLGIVSGIMIYISSYELSKEALKCRNLKLSLISSGVGVGIMLLSIILTK